MSRERRQRRQNRRRSRRRNRPGYEPVGNIRFPGVMGWFQRNPRLFYVGGIAVMLLSLGAVFFGTRAPSPPDPSSIDDRTSQEDQVNDSPDPEASPTQASISSDDIQRRYDAAPPMAIDTTHSFKALIHTERGEVHVELLPDLAPVFVNNFVFLARNHFYDDLTFHRVIPGFVAQAGDPTATGSGGPGYNLPDEHNNLSFDSGVISMAKGNGIVSGSQFFITLEPTPFLNGQFTVFGHVSDGIDVLRSLTPREGSGDPGDRILSIEIIER